METKFLMNAEDFLNEIIQNEMYFDENNKILSNIFNLEDKYIVELCLPGYKKKDVEIKIENNVLIVSGKREMDKYENSNVLKQKIKDENFKKMYELDENIDIDNIKAHFENGILKIILTKKEKEIKKIEIK